MNQFPRLCGALVLAIGTLASNAAFAEKNELSITRQNGILYLPTHVMEKQQLIEAQAAKMGMPGVTVKWLTFNGGSAQTDALLAGGVDIVNTGVGNLLLLWDRTRGGVKGIITISAQPLIMITRDPKIKTLKDFGPADKIAVPTIKVSTQAILLQMAAGRTFGADHMNKMDANTVQLGHPDAAAALSSTNHEVATHFSAPPYQYTELKTVPNARAIMLSSDIIGGPLTQGNFFTTTKFADANPKLIEALKAATIESIAFIKANPRAALEIYKEITKDKTPIDDLVELMKQPGMMDYGTAPQGTMKFATHLYKTRTLKTMPKAWTDYYLPSSKSLNGN
jgi:NitT/TauT family transport system substrate-binding protein